MDRAVIIGGGLAGAALATRLADAGRDVILVERESGPRDKLCGEFLSHEARQYLHSLGIDLNALGAVPIVAVRLCTHDDVVAVPLPFAASSLSRRVLDDALLRRAAASGAAIRRGRRVHEVSRLASTRWSARLDGHEHVEADAVFLATGKHDLRGAQRPPGWQNDLVAFKLHWQLASSQAASLRDHVDLMLFNGGYAGLQPVEDGKANLCLVVPRSRLASTHHRWDVLLASLCAESPHLAARLADGAPCSARPLALSTIPYGYVRSRSDGLWRLGDQAAVIPSFAGDGMAIALHSAEVAAWSYLRGFGADHYQRRLARDVAWQVRLATALSLGIVRSTGQSVLYVLARHWPGILSTIATGTRVPHRALARAARHGDSAWHRPCADVGP